MTPQAESEAPAPSSAGFNGLRVFAFESRMAEETAAMIRRFGGVARVAPSMREVPLENNPAAFEFARRLLAGEFDLAIFLTGVGVRELFRVIETRHPRAAIVEALGRTVTVARGPKPVSALRELGIAPNIAIPEPNTWREVLASVAQAEDLEGKRVAVQESGVCNRELIAGLQARGAAVVSVPVYRWALPEDRGPLRAAIRAIAADGADVLLFTSSGQVVNAMQTAEADGLGAELRRALATTVVCSIGPVCSAELRAHGVTVDLEPAHPRLGHLVREAAERAGALLAQKRAGAAAGAGAKPARVGGAPSAGPALAEPLSDHPLMRACRREPVPYTPIWLMRQAGRYMPEYRSVRERFGFLEMCRRPDVAAEVTVTAVERLGVDAAIIFADILLPLIPMEVGLRYEKGDGPVVERPIRSARDLDRVPPLDAAHALGFVGEAIKLARRGLGGHTPLIGFAGAPFTLASYLIEGGASRQYQATKTMMYTEPETWHRLMRLLARVTAEYLNMQVAAGADLIQLFDSWVGSLGPDDYRRFVLPHTAAVIAAIRPTVPVIHFGTVTGNLLELMREAGGDVIGLDWRVDLAEAWARLGYDVGVQGNLDPIALFANVDEIRRRARAILDQAAGRPGHIFNLGHGILPETPVDHVRALVDAVHEMSRR
ncbi:MAG TPA: uroporphyrinogen decarboxylase [Candidatus Binataceae bacterium]|nr:uroporphyrinogen decarboxylase [Candidatus Binataceae bacterium]